MSGLRPQEPGWAAALANHARRLQELERAPGQWILVGDYPADAGTTPESVPFQNGWVNAGIAGMPDFSFYLDKRSRVHLRGAVSGGALGTVIATLPLGYRPETSERFACAGTTGATVIQVDPTGDVIQVS